MLPRWLWAALVTSIALAFFAVVRQASAMPAGFCDDRGASAIAQAPALEAPDEATWRAAPCAHGEPSTSASVVPSHRGPVRASAEAPVALIASRLLVVARAPVHALAFSLPLPPRALGVRWRVERPPRG